MRSPVSRSSEGNKDVNNRLHTLRGEHFRRTLNARRTARLGHRVGPAGFSIPHAGPSLPYAEIYARPIPRSWAVAATASAPVKVSESPAWRSTALSLFFAQDSPAPSAEISESPLVPGGELERPYSCSIPSLVECCLRVLLEHFGSGGQGHGTDADSDSEDLEGLAQYLAPHHRKLAVRLCAVRSPLSGAALRAMIGEGREHIEGELVLVEPPSSSSSSSLRLEGFFRSAHTRVEQSRKYGREWAASAAEGEGVEAGRSRSGGHGSEVLGQWDDTEAGDSGSTEVDAMQRGEDLEDEDEGEGEDEEEQPLTAVAIVSATLSISVLLALPPSLTRLALVHLSAPIPVHRLPDKCPLLDFLDISYNPWLAEPAWGEERALERVAWGKWVYLKVLGCRDCGVTSDELRRVNEGRWEDVMIVT